MRRSPQGPATSLSNLARIGWLSEQPAAFQERIARLGRWIVCSRGTRIFNVADESHALFGLDEGMLDVSVPVSDDEEVVVHRAPPGFWIGEAGILAESVRTISVEAASKCRLFKIPAAAILRELAERPDDWRHFYKLTALNATLAVRSLAEVLALPPRARFARLLLRSATPDGLVSATQEELGRMAGMSRAGFRRTFGSLIDKGIAETRYGQVVIRDRAALELEAEKP